MIDAALVQRVDDARAPLGQTRRVYVERALEAALGEPVAAVSPRVARDAPHSASPRTPVGKLIDTATGHETPVRRPPTKQELDMARQLKMNTKKKGTKP
jgi:hypothetical protein